MVAHQPGAEEELIVVTFAHYADLVVSSRELAGVAVPASIGVRQQFCVDFLTRGNFYIG
jgi:hypothetical protein